MNNRHDDDIANWLSIEFIQIEERFKERWNEYKASWRQRTITWLMNRLKVEIDEFEAAPTYDQAMSEAIDVCLVSLFLLNRTNMILRCLNGDRRDAIQRLRSNGLIKEGLR